MVLTSPSGYYVDVRPFKASHQPSSAQATASQANHGTFGGKLQWAFAGTSSVTDPASGKGITRWKHIVDSLTSAPEEDKGEMTVLANGDVLERGSMRDGQSGEMRAYEEVWKDVPMPGEMLMEMHVCVVLMIVGSGDEGAEKKGYAIRIGAWCQGILEVEGRVGVERWVYDDRVGDGAGKQEKWDRIVGIGKALAGSGKQKKWERTVRFGEGELPCEYLMGEKGFKEGKEVQSGGITWTVVEVSTW